jgi:kinesin family protein 2/24
VDLTAYVERHEFVFDAVLDEHVSNDEVSIYFNVM